MSGGEDHEAINPYAAMEWMSADGTNSTHTFSGDRGTKPTLTSEQKHYLLELAGEKAKEPLTRDVTLLKGLIWEGRSPTPSFMMPTGKKGGAHLFLGLAICHSFIYFDRLAELLQNGGHEAISVSLLQCAVWNEKQHLFAACKGVLHTPSARLMNPADQHKKAENVEDENGKGLFVD